MLRTLIIGGDYNDVKELERLFQQTGRYVLLRATPDYPSGVDLERLLRAYAPEVVFLCTDRLKEALTVQSRIEKLVRGLPVVAFGWDARPEVLLELMKAGVRDFLPLPFNSQQLIQLATRLEEQISQNPFHVEATDLLFTFLPAKPGVGTTTIAVNLSICLAQQPGMRVLLLDFDLNTGMIAFMLQLGNMHSVIDALEMAERLDDELWSQLVSRIENLDVLPSGRGNIGRRIEPPQILNMLKYARRNYTVICADLSRNMEKYSIELMQESKKIFLVTTPEIAPLHLARERLLLLHNLDLADRVHLIVNRWTKRSVIGLNQIEELLELPVFAVFPNDYQEVHEAVSSGRPVSLDSELGKAFRQVAQKIAQAAGAKPSRPAEASQPKKRFLDTFSILPTKLMTKR